MWAGSARRTSVAGLDSRSVQLVAVAILLLAQARAQPTDMPSGFEQIESTFLAFNASEQPSRSLPWHRQEWTAGSRTWLRPCRCRAGPAYEAGISASLW